MSLYGDRSVPIKTSMGKHPNKDWSFGGHSHMILVHKAAISSAMFNFSHHEDISNNSNRKKVIPIRRPKWVRLWPVDSKQSICPMRKHVQNPNWTQLLLVKSLQKNAWKRKSRPEACTDPSSPLKPKREKRFQLSELNLAFKELKTGGPPGTNNVQKYKLLHKDYIKKKKNMPPPENGASSISWSSEMSCLDSFIAYYLSLFGLFIGCSLVVHTVHTSIPPTVSLPTQGMISDTTLPQGCRP